jgi:rubrerythrin
MEEGAKRIAQGLEQAMRTETDGYHFYTMAANSVQDAKGREVFSKLADDELMHLKFLRLQYRAFVDTGRPDPAAKLAPRTDLSGESPIFSPDIRGRIADAHIEMSALSIGIQLELKSEQYYRKQVEETADVAAKTFFLELADWEAGHYHALLKQQDELKEDYWAAGGFAPF